MEQLLQHEIEATETYCNISSSTTATSQKHLLQQPKKSHCNIRNHMLQHKKNYCNTGETTKKRAKQPLIHHLELTGGKKK